MTFKTIHLVKFNQVLLPLIDFVMIAILGSYELLFQLHGMPKKRENNMEILSRVLAFVSYLSD